MCLDSETMWVYGEVAPKPFGMVFSFVFSLFNLYVWFFKCAFPPCQVDVDVGGRGKMDCYYFIFFYIG